MNKIVLTILKCSKCRKVYPLDFNGLVCDKCGGTLKEDRIYRDTPKGIGER